MHIAVSGYNAAAHQRVASVTVREESFEEKKRGDWRKVARGDKSDADIESEGREANKRPLRSSAAESRDQKTMSHWKSTSKLPSLTRKRLWDLFALRHDQLGDREELEYSELLGRNGEVGPLFHYQN